MKKYNEWTATHAGWHLMAPVLLAEDDFGGIVPLPRWHLGWWLDLNLWLTDNVVNHIVGMVNEDAVGYMFWGVRELKEPRIVRVPEEQPQQ